MTDDNAYTQQRDWQQVWGMMRKGQAVVLVTPSSVALPSVLLSGGKSAAQPPKALKTFLGLVAEATTNGPGEGST